MKPFRRLDAALPLLVADLPDEASVERLLAIARAGGEAWVPLLAAPEAEGTHVLELVHPGGRAPVRVAASPIGARGPRGVPLRLALLEERAAAPAHAEGEVAHVPVEVEQARADTHEGRKLASGSLVVGALLERAPTHALHRGRHRDMRTPLVVRIVSRELAEDTSFRDRFLAEAGAASELVHPNLVRVVACGHEPDGLLWVASEQPEGQTLRERLTAEGPIVPPRLVPLALQICEALGAAHERGLVHRDIRPDNVVLEVVIDASVRPRIVAKVREIGFGLGGRLASGRIAAGAPEYMSPEQCRGEELDARSDVYAFGILLYELVTGQVPFTSDKPIVVVNRQLGMTPQPPTELRQGLDWRLDVVLGRALRKNRDERFASMAEMADEIAALARPAPSRPPKSVTSKPPEVVIHEAGRDRTMPPPAQESASPMPLVSVPPPPAVPVVSMLPPSPSAPPVATSPSQAPLPRPSTKPEWLEDAGTAHSKFLHGMAKGTSRAEDVRAAVQRDVTAYVAHLAAITDVRTFEQELGALASTVRELADKADARSLWAISSALHGIATEGRRTPGTRAALAAQALAWFFDPSLLARVAERRLAESDASAHTLLVRAGARGAHALYGARVKAAANPGVRAPFVETLTAIGAQGWAVVKAALQRMPEAALEGRHPTGIDLAEDLLASLPPIPDDDDAQVLARYLRAQVPALAEGAARALGKSVPTRAGPMLVALLDDPREGVRAAAIAGLREMGAVDAEVVAKLAPIVRREVPATPALRLAAIAALRAVVEEARAVAAPLLVAIVRSSPRGEDRIVHAAAEALLAMLGNQARAVVIDRMDQSEEPLRSALTALLANPTLDF